MRSATVGWVARSKDSVLPAQSWNSSHTRIGRASFSIAAAIAGVAVSGRPRTAAIEAQKPRKSRREMPRCSSSSLRLRLNIFSFPPAEGIQPYHVPGRTLHERLQILPKKEEACGEMIFSGYPCLVPGAARQVARVQCCHDCARD